ncbi:MAG: MazG nucleotide pyrophosphohydrolase domain-containing protein [Aquificaceae bacterium]
MSKKLPALRKCQLLQDIASRDGFEFKHIQEVFEKIQEEIKELKEALDIGDIKQLKHELGDILISVVELARFLNLDAEECLESANERFERRFGYLKDYAKSINRSISELSLEEIDRVWQQSKAFD